MRFNPAAPIGSIGATEQGFIDSSLSGSTSTVTPTLLVQPPLLAQRMEWSGLAALNTPFQFSTDEVGVTLVFELLHTPILGNLAPAPVAGSTLEMHLRPISGTDIVMSSAPTILYAPFAMCSMVFQAVDLDLLSPGVYKSMVKATLSDGQIRDFAGPTILVTSPNP